jgi:hypothetical protein
MGLDIAGIVASSVEHTEGLVKFTLRRYLDVFSLAREILCGDYVVASIYMSLEKASDLPWT